MTKLPVTREKPSTKLRQVDGLLHEGESLSVRELPRSPSEGAERTHLMTRLRSSDGMTCRRS